MRVCDDGTTAMRHQQSAQFFGAYIRGFNMDMAVDEAGVRPTSSTIPYRIAALTRCSLIAAGQEQAAQVLPVFQFGRTIALQVPRNR